jgi:hypothetical protein
MFSKSRPLDLNQRLLKKLYSTVHHRVRKKGRHYTTARDIIVQAKIATGPGTRMDAIDCNKRKMRRSPFPRMEEKESN